MKIVIEFIPRLIVILIVFIFFPLMSIFKKNKKDYKLIYTKECILFLYNKYPILNPLKDLINLK